MLVMSRHVTIAAWEWAWQWVNNGFAFSRAQTDVRVTIDTVWNVVELDVDQGVDEAVTMRMTGAEVNTLIDALREAQARLAGDNDIGALVHTLRKLATP